MIRRNTRVFSLLVCPLHYKRILRKCTHKYWTDRLSLTMKTVKFAHREKTTDVIYTMNRVRTEMSQKLKKDLGVVVDSKLSFDKDLSEM